MNCDFGGEFCSLDVSFRHFSALRFSKQLNRPTSDSPIITATVKKIIILKQCSTVEKKRLVRICVKKKYGPRKTVEENIRD